MWPRPRPSKDLLQRNAAVSSSSSSPERRVRPATTLPAHPLAQLDTSKASATDATSVLRKRRVDMSPVMNHSSNVLIADAPHSKGTIASKRFRVGSRSNSEQSDVEFPVVVDDEVEDQKDDELEISSDPSSGGRRENGTDEEEVMDYSTDPAFARLLFADEIPGERSAIVDVRSLEPLWFGRSSEKNQHDPFFVSLGESRVISRRHAKLVWNRKHRQFELEYPGKNGVHVNGVRYVSDLMDDIILLTHRARVEIGDQEFYFLLPTRLVD